MIEISVYYPTVRRVDEPAHDRVKIEFVLPKRPFLFWADHNQAEALEFPKGSGVAWVDLPRARVLYAPMPFNVLVGFSIWLWYWFRIGAARWFRQKRDRVP